MLQKGLLILAIGLLGVGSVLLLKGIIPPAWHLLVWGIILIIALVCERWRYRNLGNPVSGNWQRTGERFEDPETGQIVEVLYNPDTGERRYAAVSSPKAPPKR